MHESKPIKPNPFAQIKHYTRFAVRLLMIQFFCLCASDSMPGLFTRAFILLMFTLGKQSVFHFIVISSVCISHTYTNTPIPLVGMPTCHYSLRFVIITFQCIYFSFSTSVFVFFGATTEKKIVSHKMARKTDSRIICLWVLNAWRYFVSNFYRICQLLLSEWCR